MSTFARKQFAGSLFESGADTKQVGLVVDEIIGDQIIETFADGDTTPSVRVPNALFKTSNTGATTITDLDDGYSGQVVTVLFGDANTTVDFTASGLVGNGGADWTPAVNDSMRCIYDGTDWYCCVCTASGGGGLNNVVEDTTPQLGGNLDVQANVINTSTVNGNISIQPNGTGNVVLGNYTLDGDQTLGAGLDNYVLTYDNATGLISLEAASGGGLNNVVEDTTPQLGGNLDMNGKDIDASGGFAINLGAELPLEITSSGIIEFQNFGNTSRMDLYVSSTTFNMLGGGSLSTISITNVDLLLNDNELQRAQLTDYAITSTSPTISAGAITFDLTNGNAFQVSLTANITSITLSNPPASGSYGECIIKFVQDATGSRTVGGWPAAVKWPGGTAPTITTTATTGTDIVTLKTWDAGTTWFGDFSQDYQ